MSEGSPTRKQSRSPSRNPIRGAEADPAVISVTSDVSRISISEGAESSKAKQSNPITQTGHRNPVHKDSEILAEFPVKEATSKLSVIQSREPTAPIREKGKEPVGSIVNRSKEKTGTTTLLIFDRHCGTM